MQIVFRKLIAGSKLCGGGTGHVLNRYELPSGNLTDAELDAIACELYQKDYGHPLKNAEGVYYILE